MKPLGFTLAEMRQTARFPGSAHRRYFRCLGTNGRNRIHQVLPYTRGRKLLASTQATRLRRRGTNGICSPRTVTDSWVTRRLQALSSRRRLHDEEQHRHQAYAHRRCGHWSHDGAVVVIIHAFSSTVPSETNPTFTGEYGVNRRLHDESGGRDTCIRLDPLCRWSDPVVRSPMNLGRGVRFCCSAGTDSPTRY